MKFLISVLYFSSFYASSFADLVIPPLFYLFGDGTSDTGNTNGALSSTFEFPARQSPYGEDYTILGPNGRWSNGQLWIDFNDVVMGGLQLISYPATQLKMDEEQNAYAVNFVFAGSTALDNSTLNKHNIATPEIPSLRDQLNNFMEVLLDACNPGLVAPSCSFVNSPSVYFGSIGMMDIMYAYTQGKNYTEIINLIPSIVNVTLQVITEILQLNVPTLAVFLNFPLGCFPAIINYCNYTQLDENGCVEIVNNVTFYQNQLLISALSNLKSYYGNTQILTVDYYHFLLGLIKYPTANGFNSNTTLTPYCGDGLFNFTDQFCGGANATVCGDQNNYIHWDGIHLTQNVHKLAYGIFLGALGAPTIGGPDW